MHKKWLIAPAVVAVAALLSACSGGSTPSSNEKVTITYGVWAGTQTPAMKEIAAAFTKENPNITVKVEERPWPEYWSTLQTGAAGGTAPDAFWMLAQQIRPYAAGDQLLDISDEIKSEKVDLSKYPKAVLDLYDQGDGKIYGLPKDVDTNAVWFNKAIFDKAGVAYPSDDWTWDDFRGTDRLPGRLLQHHPAGGRPGDLGRWQEGADRHPRGAGRHQVLDRPPGRQVLADAQAAVGHRGGDALRAGQDRHVHVGRLLGPAALQQQGHCR
jgi:hypothetical protein